MHSEYYEVTKEAADKINSIKKAGGRVICVGTTSVRTVESASENGRIKAGSGWTEIFIYPGYKFKCIDRLITNFHLPESTLIMLVSSLAGKEFIMEGLFLHCLYDLENPSFFFNFIRFFLIKNNRF